MGGQGGRPSFVFRKLTGMTDPDPLPRPSQLAPGYAVAGTRALLASMNASTFAWQTSSVYCSGGLFMK